MLPRSIGLLLALVLIFLAMPTASAETRTTQKQPPQTITIPQKISGVPLLGKMPTNVPERTEDGYFSDTIPIACPIGAGVHVTWVGPLGPNTGIFTTDFGRQPAWTYWCGGWSCRVNHIIFSNTQGASVLTHEARSVGYISDHRVVGCV